MLFYKMIRQCEVTSRKYALKQGNHIGVRFIKYDKQGCGTTSNTKSKKIVAQKINVIFIFLT
jgi:hypothetical protein